jgi:LAO/AO transport system kinase
MSAWTDAALSPAALGRLLSRLENDPAERQTVLRSLPAPAGPVQRIGVTGSPGVGKSTLLARLVPLLAGRPAVLAVDPSSALSGGAVLADRFRWAELTATGAFIRSLASRGSQGGLSVATSATARVLEAAGFGPLVIETVGAGQTGFEVLGLVDTVVVLLSPESGDGLQLLKAGLLEVGDIFVVNKADRPGAEAMAADLRAALDLGEPGGAGSAAGQPPAADLEAGKSAGPAAWHPPVLSLSAQDGTGVAPLADSIAAHWAWLQRLPADHPRRIRRLHAELEHAVRARVAGAVERVLQAGAGAALAQVQSGAVSLEAAAAELAAQVLRKS